MRLERDSEMWTRTKFGYGLRRAVILLFVGACSDTLTTAPSTRAASVLADRVTGPTDARSAALEWNEIAQQLVADHSTDPPMASRFYALLSVAQWEAIRDLEPDNAEALSRAVAAASVAVLTYAYPDRASWIRDQLHVTLGGGKFAKAGQQAATAVLRRAAADGSDLMWTGTVPSDVGLWFSSVGQPPLRPRWGEVR